MNRLEKKVGENNEVLPATSTSIDVISSNNESEIYNKRLTLISDLVIGGMTIYDIYRYAKSTWNLDTHVADILVDDVCEKIHQYSEKEQKVMPARLLARFNELYAVAYAKGDFKICTQILNSQAKIFLPDKNILETENRSHVVFEIGDDEVL